MFHTFPSYWGKAAEYIILLLPFLKPLISALKYNLTYTHISYYIWWKCTISQLVDVEFYRLSFDHHVSSLHWIWGRGLLLGQCLWVSFTKCPSCINIKCIRLYYLYFCIVFVLTRCCLLAWCKQTPLSVHYLPFCQITHMKKTVLILTLITVPPWILCGKIQLGFSGASQSIRYCGLVRLSLLIVSRNNAVPFALYASTWW